MYVCNNCMSLRASTHICTHSIKRVHIFHAVNERLLIMEILKKQCQDLLLAKCEIKLLFELGEGIAIIYICTYVHAYQHMYNNVYVHTYSICTVYVAMYVHNNNNSNAY